MDQSLIRDEALGSTKNWIETQAFMTEEASNVVCRVWNGLTKWEIMVRMNTVPSTKREWEGDTKIHVQRRRLKSMVMNNTLIKLENTIQHHKLNSSEPNKCNNYDTATQWKTTEMEMCGFCVGARSLIPTCVHIYVAACSCLHALRESEYCLWCILSNITERKHSLSPLPLFPPALWTQAAAGDAVWLSTACPERRSEGRKNSLVSWQLDATNQKFGVAGGASGKVGQPVTAYWRQSSRLGKLN